MELIKELLTELYAFLKTILVNFGIELPETEEEFEALLPFTK